MANRLIDGFPSFSLSLWATLVRLIVLSQASCRFAELVTSELSLLARIKQVTY